MCQLGNCTFKKKKKKKLQEDCLVLILDLCKRTKAKDALMVACLEATAV